MLLSLSSSASMFLVLLVSGTEISKLPCIPKHCRLLTSSLVGCLLAVGVATSTAAAFGSLLWILLSSPNRPTPQLHKHQQRTGEVNSYSSMASVSCCSEPRSYGLHLDGIWLVTGTAPQPPPRGLAVTLELPLACCRAAPARETTTGFICWAELM